MNEGAIRTSFASQGLMAHLGAELSKVQPGHVEILLPFRSELSQQHGYFHAGAVTTVMDSAGGYAGLTMMPKGSSVLSVEFKVNLLAPAHGDLLRAEAKVVRSGRTLTVCTFDAHVRRDGEWTHCATGTQTLFCLPPKDGRAV